MIRRAGSAGRPAVQGPARRRGVRRRISSREGRRLGSGDDLPCESEAAAQERGKALEIEHAAHAVAKEAVLAASQAEPSE